MHFIEKLFLLFILLSFTGCSNKINEDKFILVYSDLVIAQDTLGGKVSQEAVKNTIFKKYNITEKNYNETLNYYN